MNKNVWVSKGEWRGSKTEKMGEPIQKWQREEEEHWEYEEKKTRMGTESGQGGENEEVTKTGEIQAQVQIFKKGNE